MATALISDLHLGTSSNADILRHPEVRRRLIEELSGFDRVVLLGDAVELRERPLADALAAARPFLSELGEALAGREVLLVPGNHDHQLAGPVLDARRLQPDGRLDLEQRAEPAAGGPTAEVARMLAPAQLTLAYPGIWLRPGVYATHGHQLDCHITVPTFEALAVSLVRRLLGGFPEGPLTPDDYEAALEPIYAFTFALAQGRRQPGGAPGAGASLRVWERVHGAVGRRRRGLDSRLVGGLLLPGAAAALTRAGLGPFRGDISGAEVRRAILRGIGEVVERLGIEAEHVVFGHSHRAGPLPGDDGWAAPTGARLHNTGSWVYEPRLLQGAGSQSPFWPGAYVVVEGSGPPQLKRLLTDAEGAQLVPGAVAGKWPVG